MKKCFVILSLIIVSASFVNAQKRQAKINKPPYQTVVLQSSDELQSLLKQGVDEALSKFAAKGLKGEEIAATLIDLSNPDKLTTANYRGNEKIYPASVVKMFYLVAVHQWLQDGKLKDSPELRRTMHDMIVDSSNDATQSIVDVLSGVGSGNILPEKEFKVWAFKRNVVNRYFESLEYQNINVCQKTFCEDAYGIEQQFRGKDGVNRNKLTTDATAQLLSEIVLNKAVTADRTKQMMELLTRNWEGTSTDNDDQSHGFTGIALNDLGLKGAKLWSKAGWTSKTRHDAAYIELPNEAKFVLVVFTENHATERDIIPSVARIILKGFAKTR
jgi:beta-lactamase class A